LRRLAAWLGALSARERRLVAAAAAAAAATIVVQGVLAVRNDLATLHARVAGHERDLAAVRRAVAALGRGAPVAADGTDRPALLARLEAAAGDAVGRERIASMTPAAGPVEDGLSEERVTLGVRGASLADTVRLLHRLETSDPPLHVVRVELRKHPDDPAHFDAAVEVAELRAVP